MLAQEAVKHLCGQPVLEGKAIVYNGLGVKLHRAELSRDPACPAAHHAYEGVIELPRRAAETTAEQLFAIARGQDSTEPPLYLELGRDFLLAFHCPQCDRKEQVDRIMGQVSVRQARCTTCGATRDPQTLQSIQEGGPHADVPLAELGVPPGEVLALHSAAGLRFYEFSADVFLTNLQSA